jgi:SpoVK/Ycf46/Vps4 family AAA+-type ATPase
MRAVANELDIPIQIINGPELVSEIIGRNPSAIRDALYQAKENAPSVIFFDDVDVLASKESLNNEAVKRAMSQFLMDLNGMRPREKVVVVAATNRPHLLDSSLLGRGRFDKMFYIPPPDLQARKDIFGILLKGIPKVGSIDN